MLKCELISDHGSTITHTTQQLDEDMNLSAEIVSSDLTLRTSALMTVPTESTFSSLQNENGIFMNSYEGDQDQISNQLHNSKESDDMDHLTPLDGLKSSDSHKTSCHRCGNIRRKITKCTECCYLFCFRCTEKMKQDYGLDVFILGCPVCKELCCCGKNKTVHCTRKNHCYRKCPASKNQVAANNPTERNKRVKREQSNSTVKLSGHRGSLNIPIVPKENFLSAGAHTPQFAGSEYNGGVSNVISELSDRESPLSIDSLKSMLDDHDFDSCFPISVQQRTDDKSNIPLFVTNSKNKHRPSTGNSESNFGRKAEVYNHAIRQEYNDLVLFGPPPCKTDFIDIHGNRSGRPVKRIKTLHRKFNGNSKENIDHEIRSAGLICTNSGTTATPDSSHAQSNDMHFDSYEFADFGDFDNFIDYRYGMSSPLALSPTQAIATGNLSEELSGRDDCCGLGYSQSCFTAFSQEAGFGHSRIPARDPDLNEASISMNFEHRCMSSNFLGDKDCFSMTPVGTIISEETIGCQSTDCTAVDDYLSCNIPQEFFTELAALCSNTVTI